MPYLIGIGVTLGLFALFVSSRPSSFRLERSLVIDADPADIYRLIDDFHAWVGWSPWENVDPTMSKTYEGAPSGVGAVYRWTGDKVGAGVMTVTDATEHERVEIQLDFIKPIEAHNKTVFTLEPAGVSTRVSWAMTGTNGFVAKAFGIFMPMEKMVGPDFERGLAALKKLAEEKKRGASMG